MLKGSIVKVRNTMLYNERTMRRNNSIWIYGVLDFIEDICEDIGQKSWNVKWATRYLLITMDSWNHVCAVLEENMEIVRKPDEGDALLHDLYQTKDFFCKVNGL